MSTPGSLEPIVAAARAWRDQDPDDATRGELDAIVTSAEAGDAAAETDLADRFSSRLAFGTAGLRGALGAGPARMNRVLVTQAAAGLAAFLLKREEHPSVVVGYDGRTNSPVFATDTAEIMAGAGVRVILLPRLLPTPVLAFAVRELRTSAGVMVTASHNPAADNGYKVYLGGFDNGSQIVPPDDGLIAAEIERVAAGDIRELLRSTEYEIARESVIDEYVRRTAGVAGRRLRKKHGTVVAEGGPVDARGPGISFVYTAMHGVGWQIARRVFAEAGFSEPTAVAGQVEPDAAFPTVAFPNPEEPGAMDLAFATASAVGADLVIANDPDADRLAVGVPTVTGWRRMSGNEIGALLGWRAAERVSAADAEGTLACSIVSSPALAEVARKYRLHHDETLTGFKWISRSPGLSFGYEEALGYLVDPDVVRDKDGISAAVDVLALATELKAAGKTLADHAIDFAARFGAYASSQISVRVSDTVEISRVMARLRADPPSELGGVDVTTIDDFEEGFGEFPPGDILRIWTADGSRVIVRPSGTEPKLKIYVDASSTAGSATERIAAAEAKVAALDAAMRELIA